VATNGELKGVELGSSILSDATYLTSPANLTFSSEYVPGAEAPGYMGMASEDDL
jgi:hypothetical protein